MTSWIVIQSSTDTETFLAVFVFVTKHLVLSKIVENVIANLGGKDTQWVQEKLNM